MYLSRVGPSPERTFGRHQIPVALLTEAQRTALDVAELRAALGDFARGASRHAVVDLCDGRYLADHDGAATLLAAKE